MAAYPEHEKLKTISALSQAQGDFVEWLQAQGITLARYGARDLEPIHEPIEKLLARYHGIDLEKIEAEKRAMLDEIRKVQSRGWGSRGECLACGYIPRMGNHTSRGNWINHCRERHERKHGAASPCRVRGQD